MYTTDTQLDVKWYKDGSHISEKNPRLKINTTRKGKYHKLWSRLCVKSVVLSDKGKYACQVNSNRSSSIKEGILQVQSKYIQTPKLIVVQVPETTKIIIWQLHYTIKGYACHTLLSLTE